MSQSEKQQTQSTTEDNIESDGLTGKQRLFVENYLQSWNASDAARRAGYSPKTAYIIGFENLRKPKIKAFIDKRLDESAMSASEVLKRLGDQARASLLPFIDITKDGFVYFDFSHPDAKNYMHLIKKIKSKRARRLTGRGEDAEIWEDEWVEVELYDAQGALALLAKHHKLLTENVDLTTGGEKIKGYINFNPDEWDKDGQKQDTGTVPTTPVATGTSDG